MKILYVLKNDPDPTVTSLMEAQRKEHQVQAYDLSKEKDYGRLVDLLFQHDRVVSW